MAMQYPSHGIRCRIETREHALGRRAEAGGGRATSKTTARGTLHISKVKPINLVHVFV